MAGDWQHRRQLDQLTMNKRTHLELSPYLARFRRRLRLRSGLGFLQRSLWVACLAGVIILLAGRIWPLEGTRLWALAPLGLWAITSLAVLLLQPYPDLRVALSVDGELDLKERISTSLVFSASQVDLSRRSFNPQLVEQMNADALSAVSKIDAGRTFPARFEWRRLAVGAALLVGMFLLAFLPNPMDQVIAERKAVAQAAREQAQKIEELKKEVENTAELSPEEKQKLLDRLAELARQLQSNPGDREQALADINRAEQAIRERVDPGAAARKAAMEGIAARLQALAGLQKDERLGDLQKAAEDLQKLADQLGQMTQEQRDQLAKDLGQLAARASQAGDSSTAQALAALAQAALSGDSSAAQQAAQSGQQALNQAAASQSDQQALQRALSGVQSSRQAMSQAGASGQTASQGQGQGQGQSQGQGQGQGQSQGQGQGQGQGRPSGGGGSQANTLPPAQGRNAFTGPNSSKPAGGVGDLNSQVYVPREKLPTNGDQLFIPGQDTGQGSEQTSQSPSPLPGASNPSLVPYSSVYQSYLDTAGQALDQSAIPADLKDFVRGYFSNLEP